MHVADGDGRDRENSGKQGRATFSTAAPRALEIILVPRYHEQRNTTNVVCP